MINSYGYVTDTGVNSREQTQGGWSFIYTSTKLHETLNINVSEKETRITRQTWTLRNIAISKVKIDSNTALQKVTAAVKDRTFKPDEIYPSGYEQVEVLYEIPASAIWDVRLEQNNQKLYWGISFSMYAGPVSIPGWNPSAVAIVTPTPSPSATSSEAQFYYSGGYATVDAETGEISSLTRIKKYTALSPTVVMSAVPTVTATASP